MEYNVSTQYNTTKLLFSRICTNGKSFPRNLRKTIGFKVNMDNLLLGYHRTVTIFVPCYFDVTLSIAIFTRTYCMCRKYRKYFPYKGTSTLHLCSDLPTSLSLRSSCDILDILFSHFRAITYGSDALDQITPNKHKIVVRVTAIDSYKHK